MAQGSRLPGMEGVRVGVIPRAFTFLSMGTGEPDASKVARPVRGGTGRKGNNDLARGLPYLVPRSHFRQQVSASVSALAAQGKNQKSLQRTGCTMLTLCSEGYKGSQENEHRKPMSV